MTRKLVAMSDRKPADRVFRYFVQTLDGADCCAANDPENMCDDCANAVVTATDAPPPVSLAAKIREARSLETRYAETRRKTGDNPGLLETLKAKAHERAEALK